MVSEPSWLVRLVERYSIATDELVDETVLPPLDLAAIQSLWGLPPDESMVDCFAIGPEQAPYLADLTGIRFDFAKYSYFLSARSTDLEAQRREGGYMGRFAPPATFGGFPALVKAKPKTPA